MQEEFNLAQLIDSLVDLKALRVEVEKIYNSDQFNVLQELKDLFCGGGSGKRAEISQCFYIWFLYRDFKNDQLTISSEFESLMQVLKDKGYNDLAGDTVLYFLMHFNDSVKLSGYDLSAYIQSHDLIKCQMATRLIAEASTLKKNQVKIILVDVFKENCKQKILLHVDGLQEAISSLISLAQEKTPVSVKHKMKNGIVSENESLATFIEIKRDAILALLNTFNDASAAQQKHIIKILKSNYKDIEKICRGDENKEVEYFFLLFQKSKSTLVADNREHTLKLIDRLSTTYTFQQVVVNFELIDEFRKTNQNNLSSRLSSFKSILLIEEGIDKVYSQANYKVLFKFTSFEILTNILDMELSTKEFKQIMMLIFQAILSISQITQQFLAAPETNPESCSNEFWADLEIVIESICSGERFTILKIPFIDFIMNRLFTINKRISSLNKGNIQWLDLRDKWNMMGCYNILQCLSTKIVDDIRGLCPKFINLFPQAIGDDHASPFCIGFLVEMAVSFNSTLAAIHSSFVPQSIAFLNSTYINASFKNVEMISNIFDLFFHLYSHLVIQREKDLYIYLSEIFQICLKAYSDPSFFNLPSSLFKSIQNLINLILNLPRAEDVLKHEIQQAESVFLSLQKDPLKQDLLIKKCHYSSISALLNIKQRMQNTDKELTQLLEGVIIQMVENLEKGKIPDEEICEYYEFLKKVNLNCFNDEKFTQKIFLKILPFVVRDSQIKSGYKINQLIELAQQINGEIDEDDIHEEQDEEFNSEGNIILNGEENIRVSLNIDNEEKEDLRNYATSLLGELCLISPPLFMNYKKFDILGVLINNQYDSSVTPDIIMCNQKSIGKAFFASSCLLLDEDKSLNKLRNCDQEDPKLQFLSEDSIVELKPILVSLLKRIQIFDQLPLYSNCTERNSYSLMKLLKKIDKIVIRTFFDEIYTTVEKCLFIKFMGTNEVTVDYQINCLKTCLESYPSKIKTEFPRTWNLIQKALTSTLVDMDYYQYLESWKDGSFQKNYIEEKNEEYNNQGDEEEEEEEDDDKEENQEEEQQKSQSKQQQQQELQIDENAKLQQDDQKNKPKYLKGIKKSQWIKDSSLICSCLSDIYELLKIDKNIYDIISPIYNSCILYCNITSQEQFLQGISQYLKYMMVCSYSLVNQEEFKILYKRVEKCVLEVDENTYQEMSPIENLRLAFGLMGCKMYHLIEDKKEKKHFSNFKIFLSCIPLTDEQQELSFALIVINQIIHNDYELSKIETKNIITQLLLAIDSPQVYEISDKDKHLCCKLLYLLMNRSEENRNVLNQLIEVPFKINLLHDKEYFLKLISQSQQQQQQQQIQQ